MKIKLSYFLGKRGVTLKKYCKLSGITSHTQLEENLLEHRIECPSKSETSSIFLPTKKKRVVFEKKSHTTTQKKSQKSSLLQSKKRKTWSD